MPPTETIADSHLPALCDAFLNEWGDLFRRTAAARNYHHARRGGLVEQMAQMMRVAKEIPYFAVTLLALMMITLTGHLGGILSGVETP